MSTIKEEFEDQTRHARKNINQKNPEQQTPLHLAAIFDHEKVIRYLIEEGAIIDALSEHDDTPLHLSIKYFLLLYFLSYFWLIST